MNFANLLINCNEIKTKTQVKIENYLPASIVDLH